MRGFQSKITSAQAERMAEMYAEGYNLVEIAEQEGVSVTSVSRKVREKGLKVRRRVGRGFTPKRPEGADPNAEFDRLYWGTPITKEQHALLNSVWYE
jgi:uncharacterized protein YjcR